MKIFADYVECGRDTMKVEARFEARLEETQRTQVRYGFRNDIWLNKHHGERKALKIMARKKELGLILGFICSLKMIQISLHPA
jgi:creatinine amidohydrolase/Fe(II)-dependent formamide hydrolase-like protein